MIHLYLWTLPDQLSVRRTALVCFIRKYHGSLHECFAHPHRSAKMLAASIIIGESRFSTTRSDQLFIVSLDGNRRRFQPSLKESRLTV
jgi:hypothetical protein